MTPTPEQLARIAAKGLRSLSRDKHQSYLRGFLAAGPATDEKRFHAALATTIGGTRNDDARDESK